MQYVDLAIVGGGPAGLAAAIEARQRGLDAVVLERHSGVIDKACGEGLMPAAIQGLTELGVEIPDGRALVGVSYHDAEDPQVVAHGSFTEPGRGVRRTALHGAMRQRADDLGCDVISHTVRRVEQHHDFVDIDDRFRARWLIAADGLHSRVRRDAGFATTDVVPTRFGIRRHFDVAPWSDHVEVYWSDVGEAYVTPVDDDRVGVAMLFNPPGRFTDLLAHFPLLRDRLGDAPPVTDARGAGALCQRVDEVRRGRVLLIGDAAGYEDALTGEGIAIATTSAAAAVGAVADGRPANYAARYRNATRSWRWGTRALLTLTRPRWIHKPLIRLLRRYPAIFNRALALLGDA